MQAGVLQLHVAGACEGVDAEAAWHDALACWAEAQHAGRHSVATRCLFALATTRNHALRDATLEVRALFVLNK